jgi:hypothetical protein
VETHTHQNDVTTKRLLDNRITDSEQHAAFTQGHTRNFDEVAEKPQWPRADKRPALSGQLKQLHGTDESTENHSHGLPLDLSKFIKER